MSQVYNGVVLDSAAENPVPKPLGQILAFLAGLNINQGQAAYADYLNSGPRLKVLKAKVENGVKLYTQAQPAAGLTKSFTNYAVRDGDESLFDGGGNAIAKSADSWKAVQHFPATNATPTGVKEMAT